MKILFLYQNTIAFELIDWIKELGHEVKTYQDVLNYDEIKKEKFDLAISYTYRFIIKKDIIELLNGNIINLHISYLPWNRGANPNQWSFLENTPKGVTIHYVDSKLDNGDIITQKLVEMDLQETFKSSYDKLNQEIIKLFKESFIYYSYWQEMRKKPKGKGTYHSVKDFEPYTQYISSWDMKVEDFQNQISSFNVE